MKNAMKRIRPNKNMVRPFSNGTEFLLWKEENCDGCIRYENKSTKASNAKCNLAFYLDLGSATDGMIPSDVALRIGVSEYNGIEMSCTLSRCKNFNKPVREYPRKRKIDKLQTELKGFM